MHSADVFARRCLMRCREGDCGRLQFGRLARFATRRIQSRRQCAEETLIQLRHDTMHTQRIKGIEPLSIDKKVLATIKKEARPWDFGTRYRIAVRNAAGVIYRVAEMDSLGIYVGIREGLLGLSLADEVAPSGNVDGFDSIFCLPHGGGVADCLLGDVHQGVQPLA
jgi:hypothetical protein